MQYKQPGEGSFSTQGSGSLIAGATNTIAVGLANNSQVRVEWLTDAGWNGTLAIADDGTTVATLSNNSSPGPVFRRIQVVAEWCFGGMVRNHTMAPHEYEVYYVTNGGGRTFKGLMFIGSLQNSFQEFGPFAEKGTLEFMAKPTAAGLYLGDGVYAGAMPGFTEFYFDDDAGWYSCATAGTTNIITHFPADQNGAMLAYTNSAPAELLAALGSTNALRENLYAHGTAAQLMLQEAANEEQRNANAEMQRLLGQISTNTAAALTNSTGTNELQKVADTNQSGLNIAGYQSAATTAANGLSNSLSTVSIGGVTNFTSAGAHDADLWKVTTTFGAFDEVTFDFNPMNQPGISTIASWVKGILAWGSWLGLCMFALKQGQQLVNAAGSWTQTRAPNMGVTVAGFGFQTSILLHAIIYALIIGLLVVLFSGYITLINSSGATTALLTDPFHVDSPVLIEVMWFAEQWLPLTVWLANVAFGVAYMVALAAFSFGAQLIIRAMPSAIILGLFTLTANAAARIEVRNASAAGIYCGTELGWHYVPSGGQALLSEVTGDLDVYTDTNAPPLSTLATFWDAQDLLIECTVLADFSIASASHETFETGFYWGVGVMSPIAILMAAVYVMRKTGGGTLET